MREVDDLLKRRPGLAALAADAGALRDQLSKERGSSVPGAPALTAAQLRLLPLLSTHLSFPQIARDVPVPPHGQVGGDVDLPQAGGLLRSQAVARSHELGLPEG